MKKLFLTLAAVCGFASVASAQLTITSVFDGPMAYGTPKGVELYATQAIDDLSGYSLQAFTNGSDTGGSSIDFFGSVEAGEYIYVYYDRSSGNFDSFFEIDADAGVLSFGSTSAANLNGDDAVALFLNSDMKDVFGRIGEDGTGTSWEYTDGWAYRSSGTLASSTFEVSEWTFSGVDIWGDATTNASASNSIPIGTYAVPEPSTYALIFGGLAVVGFAYRRRKQAK